MKYSLRSLMIVVTLVCVLLGGVAGRVDYLRRWAAFHRSEALRIATKNHSSVREALPDATVNQQHWVLENRFRSAIWKPWTIVDANPPAIQPSVAILAAEEMVEYSEARQALQQLHTSLDAYYADHGTYPTEENARKFLLSVSWVGEIRYSLVSRQEVKIQSAAFDSEFNTDDDITLVFRPLSENSSR